MKSLIKKWNGKIIDDGITSVSKEWQSFSRAFKAAVKREGAKYGYELAGKKSFGVSHYFVSGHIKKDDAYYYISYSYDRFNPVNLTDFTYAGPILWRRALDEKDYSGKGGHNNFTTADRLFEEIENDRIRRNGVSNGIVAVA